MYVSYALTTFIPTHTVRTYPTFRSADPFNHFKMGALGLVPSDGLRADKTSPSSTASSSETSNESQAQAQTQVAVHQSWPGDRQRTASPPQPFVATVEPMDITSEEQAQNILCQKVLILAAQLFPETRCSKDLQVEYIGSGSFHDVVGFTVPTLKLVTRNPDDTAGSGHFAIEEEKYVVRMPRSDVTDPNVDMRRDIAVLRGLSGRLDVPIPRVIAFNVTKNNLLDAPYTLETRLRGRSLEDLVSKDTSEEQNVYVLKQVVQLVENLAQVTAPYAGWIAEEFGEGIDRLFCSSGIPMKFFDFPFDASALAELPDRRPLTFMLKLVDLWLEYEHECCPNEDNFASWFRIKAILHSLQRHDLLGETFHLSHGDLASRNILAEIVDESSIEITGVVDWDFACFAPKFCMYRAPMDMWDGGEDVAIEECTSELVEIFKTIASPEYVRYAVSVDAQLGRKIWYTLRTGMVGEERRWYASNNIWEWERLHPEDNIGKLH